MREFIHSNPSSESEITALGDSNYAWKNPNHSSGKTFALEVVFRRWIPDSLGTASTSVYFKQRKSCFDKFFGGPG